MQEKSARAEHESLEGYLSNALTAHQRERVLLTNFNHWFFAQGALADTALVLNEMGSEVFLAFWSSKTPMLDVAWTTSPILASVFRSPSREQGIRTALIASGIPLNNFLAPPIRTPPLRRWKPRGELEIPRVLSRSNIRRMRYRGADLGRAILQVHPTAETPLNDQFLWPKRWVKAAARSFAFVFDQVSDVIETHGITTLAVYNGRFLHDRAAAAAAKSMGLSVLNYDVGGLETDFDLTIDDTHDWDALQSRMLKMYESWDVAEREELGSKWFVQRTQHLDPSNSKFVESQKIGKSIDLPQDRKTVVYFSSSGDEIAELDLDWNAFFGGQENALKVLAKECREMNYFLVVRSHPHKRMKPKEDVSEWLAAIEEIAPDIHLDPFADIDSYTLMRQADVIVTYGSTTGVEAAFAKKPVIVMGPSAYDKLGAAKGVSTRDELASALSNPQPGSLIGAVSFGLMMQRRGFTYTYVSRTPSDGLVINGVDLEDSTVTVRNLSHAVAKIRRRKLLSGKWGQL